VFSNNRCAEIQSQESKVETYHFLQAVKSFSRHDWKVEATQVPASDLSMLLCTVVEEVEVSQNIKGLAAALSLDSSRSFFRAPVHIFDQALQGNSLLPINHNTNIVGKSFRAAIV
jgi:hypothetical protein